MPKIKICFGITKGGWGGAQRYVYDIATNLPRDICGISAISGAPGLLCEKLKAQNIPVFILDKLNRDISPLRDLSAFFSLLRLLQKNKPDILHLNSPKMGLLGAAAGRLAGVKKIIYTSHGWPFLENRNLISKLFFKILCWKITLLCHQVIVISQSEKTDQKFKLVYNGISEINFLSKTEARKKLNQLNLDINSEKIIIGTIAELHQNKGLNYLAEAAEKINADFIVIGEGEERESLENTKLKLAGNIPDAASLLSAFDIFVLPSIKEGLPYVISEAGLAGLPVVATRVGGIPEMIENNVSGFTIGPKNPRELAEKIEFLIENPEIRKMFGERLQKNVREKFSLERMVRETREIYEE